MTTSSEPPTSRRAARLAASAAPDPKPSAAEPGDRRPLGGRRASVAAAACAVAAYPAALLASGVVELGAAARSGPWPWLATGGVLTAASVAASAMALRAHRRATAAIEQAEDAARDDLHRVVHRAIGPSLSALTDLAGAAPGSRETARDAVIAAVLEATVTAVGARDARACWYALVDGRVRSLQPRAHAGRLIPPTSVFVAGTPAGDEALGALDIGATRSCRDVADTPPAGWDAEGLHDYATFIAVPVTDAKRCYGMLTIDAPGAGSLSGDAVRMLRLFAEVLTTAMGIGEPTRTIVVPGPRSVPVQETTDAIALDASPESTAGRTVPLPRARTDARLTRRAAPIAISPIKPARRTRTPKHAQPDEPA